MQSRYSGLGLKTGRWDQGATRSRACDPLLGVSPVKSLVNCFDILGWYRAILSASCAILRWVFVLLFGFLEEFLSRRREHWKMVS